MDANDEFEQRMMNLNMNNDVDFIDGADPKSVQVQGGEQIDD